MKERITSGFSLVGKSEESKRSCQLLWVRMVVISWTVSWICEVEWSTGLRETGPGLLIECLCWVERRLVFVRMSLHMMLLRLKGSE